jgi:hypothetical protein
VKAPISDEAANTVIVPVVEALPALLVLGDEVGEPLLEQPAAATAASAAAKTAKRRIVTPRFNQDPRSAEIS